MATYSDGVDGLSNVQSPVLQSFEWVVNKYVIVARTNIRRGF